MRSNGKLSDEKLEMLLKELKRYDIQVTNRDRLAALPERKLVAELKKKFIDNDLAEYIDLQAWLRSGNPKLIYIGEDAMYYNDQRKLVPCKIIEESKELGNKYVLVIDLAEEKLVKTNKGDVKK